MGKDMTKKNKFKFITKKKLWFIIPLAIIVVFVLVILFQHLVYKDIKYNNYVESCGTKPVLGYYNPLSPDPYMYYVLPEDDLNYTIEYKSEYYCTVKEAEEAGLMPFPF